MVRAGTVPAALPTEISCPSRQDPSLPPKPSAPLGTDGCSVDQSGTSERDHWTSRGIGHITGLSRRLPEISLKTSLADFLALRGCPIVASTQAPSPLLTPDAFECVGHSGNSKAPSQEPHVNDGWDSVLPLVSKDIVLPESWCEPSEDHYYLGSLDFIQRLGLVEHLRAHCRVHLVEAETLHGPDVILDSHSCAVFHPIVSLAGTNTEVCKLVVDLAKSFSRILVVLEAFPASKANYSVEPPQPFTLNILSSIVLHAFQKFVHRLTLATAMLDKREGGDVHVDIVVAGGVSAAARYVRVYGEACAAREARSCRGVLWGARPWLQTEVRPRLPPSPVPRGWGCVGWLVSLTLTPTPFHPSQDGNEWEIGAWPGMNTFVSRLIASKMSLWAFIDMALVDKLASFGLLVGSERMVRRSLQLLFQRLPGHSTARGFCSFCVYSMPHR
jgi:hypothetical protein